jgi:hypothetical protein
LEAEALRKKMGRSGGVEEKGNCIGAGSCF